MTNTARTVAIILFGVAGGYSLTSTVRTGSIALAIITSLLAIILYSLAKGE